MVFYRCTTNTTTLLFLDILYWFAENRQFTYTMKAFSSNLLQDTTLGTFILFSIGQGTVVDVKTIKLYSVSRVKQ